MVKFEMKFCLSGREFKAILSKFIEINADTIKFLEKTILLLIANFATTKVWAVDIILKLVDEIYAMFISIAAVKF
mgnify:CR=1 FL=1